MSIVTLKRKSQAKYNNMSVGQKNFSIAGTHRNQGYIGQTTLSRSLPKTLMKGNVEKGMGGCCGTYNLTPIVQSAVTSLEDSSVIKTSTMGNHGLLMSKYRWTRRPGPATSVKPDNNQNTNTANDYIMKLKKRTILESNKCNNASAGIQPCSFNYNPYFRQNLQFYSKPESAYLAMKSSEYTEKFLNNSCTLNEKVFSSPSTNGPLPGN